MNNVIFIYVLFVCDFNYEWSVGMCEVFDFKIWIYVKVWFDNVMMFFFVFENDF